MKQIDVQSLTLSPFIQIGEEWMLITAGTMYHYNMMTASWGAIGVLWGAPAATIYVRPQRYTRKLIEQQDLFTLSFFDSSYHQALSFCGSHSGRDCDKTKETGLTPISLSGTTAFSEANLILVCRKKYRQDMNSESFLDPQLLTKWYPNHDLHTMYVGEIIDAYQSE